MRPITIDLQNVTPDLLRHDDNPALAAAVNEAIGPRPMVDGAGFNNQL